MVIVFPLARSKRADTMAAQVIRCRPERRAGRLSSLLEIEREKLVALGITPSDADRQVSQLLDRVVFIVNSQPLQELA